MKDVMKVFRQRYIDRMAVIESLYSSFNELSQNYASGWCSGEADFY